MIRFSLRQPLFVAVTALLCLGWLGVVRPAPAAADQPGGERKVALVIGNSAYQMGKLKNPVNDAKAISESLAALGFEVTGLSDLSQVEMKRAIDDFGDRIRNGGVGLFYFAGHGMQVNGNNYLIPVDAKIESEHDVEYDSVNVGRVLAKMANARNRLNIVILDACRDNPFARSWRSASRGLAYMMAPSGTLIAYATAPGSTASDGTADNGLYTEQLLQYIKVPGLRVEDVFKRVRTAVRQYTDGRQVPWESSSLEGDFYFAGRDGAGPAATAMEPAAVSSPTPQPQPQPTPQPVPQPVPQTQPVPQPQPQSKQAAVAPMRPVPKVASTPWVFPDSDRRYLTDDDLRYLTPDQLWQARNEIFARRGYLFKTARGKAFAARLGSHYHGTEPNSSRVYSRFNDYERANVLLIKEYENR